MEHTATPGPTFDTSTQRVMAAANGAGIFNVHSSGSSQPVQLTIRDTRYREPLDAHSVVFYRPY